MDKCPACNNTRFIHEVDYIGPMIKWGSSEEETLEFAINNSHMKHLHRITCTLCRLTLWYESDKWQEHVFDYTYKDGRYARKSELVVRAPIKAKPTAHIMSDSEFVKIINQLKDKENFKKLLEGD